MTVGHPGGVDLMLELVGKGECASEHKQQGMKLNWIAIDFLL